MNSTLSRRYALEACVHGGLAGHCSPSGGGISGPIASHPDALKRFVRRVRLPPHVTGLFREPAGFVARNDGSFLVFDRRAHAVYRVSADRANANQLVSIGHENGRLIQPVAFAVGADGTFVVADAPFGRQRVQLFGEDGTDSADGRCRVMLRSWCVWVDSC